MTSRPPRPVSPRPPRSDAPGPATAPAHGLVVTARSATQAAHGALRDRLLDLGGPLLDGRSVPPPPSAGGVDVSEDPADLGAARAGARDRVHAAVAAYARAMRSEGLDAAAAVAAVGATVHADAAFLPADQFAALRRDAAACCLDAFHAH